MQEILNEVLAQESLRLNVDPFRWTLAVEEIPTGDDEPFVMAVTCWPRLGRNAKRLDVGKDEVRASFDVKGKTPAETFAAIVCSMADAVEELVRTAKARENRA